MAIVLKKKIAVPQPVEKVDLLSEHADLIDKVGRLTVEMAPTLKKLAELNTKLKPLKDTDKALKDALASIDAGDDATGIELGAEYAAEYGARGTARTITDMKKIHEMLGDELFYQLAEMKLGDIDKYLTLPQREKVIKTDRTTRSVKVVKRVA